MSRRALARWGIAVALAALAVHVVFHYLPRARAARPVGELAEPFPRSPAARFELWLPYPHQNLARLDRSVGGLRVWASQLDAGRAIELPSFGPFLVPPARELRAELGRDGGLRVAARIYPAIAALARAAGAVAGNPWLAGGEPPGHPGASVSWRNTTWSLTQPAEKKQDLSVQDQNQDENKDKVKDFLLKGVGGASAAADDGAEVEGARSFPSMEVFALVWLGEPLGALPRGVYRVVDASVDGRGVELISGESPPARSWARELVDPEAGAPVGWLAERDAAGRVRGVAVWEGESAVGDLPAIAVFESAPARVDPGGDFSFSLPGEGLLQLVGEETPEAVVAGLRIRALDRETVSRAEGWVAALSSALAASAGGGEAALGAAVPEKLETLLATAGRVLRSLPFVDPREGERFARAAALLAPVRDCPLATLEVGGAGGVRMRPCAAGVLAGGRSD